MSSLLETLAIGIADEYSLEKVKNLFLFQIFIFQFTYLIFNTEFKLQKMLVKGAGIATNSPSFVINQVKTNIKWVNNYEKKICDYLKNLV
jgi:hypothetical protein